VAPQFCRAGPSAFPSWRPAFPNGYRGRGRFQRPLQSQAHLADLQPEGVAPIILGHTQAALLWSNGLKGDEVVNEDSNRKGKD